MKFNNCQIAKLYRYIRSKIYQSNCDHGKHDFTFSQSKMDLRKCDYCGLVEEGLAETFDDTLEVVWKKTNRKWEG